MYKALIFDLDGVLILSEKPTFYLLQDLLQRRGYKLKNSAIKARSGKRIVPFLDEVFKNEISQSEKQEIYAEFSKEYTGNIEKYIEEISTTAKFIRNYRGSSKLGLATMSDMKEIDKILPSLGLADAFEVIVAADHISKSKPHPEVYLKAAKLLGCEPGECAAIEDSLVGARSACGAGVATYIFLNGLNKKDDFSGLPIAGFLEKAGDFAKLSRP